MKGGTDVENFIPKGIGEVKRWPDGTVKQIIAVCQGKKVLLHVIDGQPKRGIAPGIPYFQIPDEKVQAIYRQIRGVISDGKKKAKMARDLKKPDWTRELAKYSVVIMDDGRLSVSRWTAEKNGGKKRVWQTVGDINAAIRMQDHIIENYMENGQEIQPEFPDLPNRLSVILPYIEMRRELLIFAQKQMETSIHRVMKGFDVLLNAEGTERERCHGLPEKLERLIFFLNNAWPGPYREKVDRIMPLIKKAKKAAIRLQWKNTESCLLDAKNILSPALEVCGRQGPPISLAEINPIAILARVDKLGLTGEVMAVAKKVLPEPYCLKNRGLFRLNALLAVSRLVIEGKFVSREEILKLL